MLSNDKLKLFVDDMCALSGEDNTPIIHHQVSELTRILTATGCGSWPFNTPDQNFFEYMSALSVAVSHLFKMPNSKRPLFIENGLANVNLTSALINEQLPMWITTDIDIIEWIQLDDYSNPIVYTPWIPTELDTVEWLHGAEFDEPIVYRPTAYITGRMLPIQYEPPAHDECYPLAVYNEELCIREVLQEFKVISPCQAAAANKFLKTKKATLWYYPDEGLFRHHSPIGSKLLPNCNPTGSHLQMALHNMANISLQLDRLLYETSVDHLQCAIYRGAVPYLMSSLPAKAAASFMRYRSLHFCGKFSSKMKTTLAFLQNLVTQTMCPN